MIIWWPNALHSNGYSRSGESADSKPANHPSAP